MRARSESTASRRRGQAVLVVLVALLPVALRAQIANGSFENAADHLAGWSVAPGSRVEALRSSDIGPGTIAAPDGAWFAMLSTGPGDVAGAGDGDLDGNGTPDFDAARLSATFSTSVPGERLSFSWSFLTDEVGPGAQGAALYDDLFDIRIDGYSIVRGSVRKPGGSSPFTDTAAYDGARYTVGTAGPTGGSDFGSAAGGGRTAFRQVCLAVAEPGTYTLEFLVADQGDALRDGALLVDAVALGAPCDPTLQVTDTAGASLELKGGAFVFTPVSNGRLSIDREGWALTFRSNADLAGDNPSLQEQLWIATPAGAGYAFTRVTALSGADLGDPSISAGGRWLALASTGDLVPPGNADGNAEIFRLDRSSGGWAQITSTAGCQNATATINDDGSRIAFLSDCDLGFGAGDDEVVLWDGSFRGRDTSGCVNRHPTVSSDAAGRFVTFLTDCDGAYPGVSNPDRSTEIVQWDTASDLYLQITDTPAGAAGDAPSTSADGRYVALVSNADLEPGQNPAGDFAVFRHDALDGTFLQLTDPDPLKIYTDARIDASGGFVALERLDLLSGGFDVLLVDAASPRTLQPVAIGAPGVTNSSPVVAVSGNRPVVAFLSDGNASGNNPDANVEVWIGAGAFVAPARSVLCSAPGRPIPDRDNQGIVDSIAVTDAGTIVDLDLRLRIRHSWVGDLRVILRHVASDTRRQVIDRPGAPPGAGCAGDDVDATLDDEAASDVDDVCDASGPVAIAGSFRPDRSLAQFDGLSLAGVWELEVSDRSRLQTGALLEWCLVPTVR